MDEDAERADLERRISDAGWHILRDEHAPEGYMVEFQQGTYTVFHPGAATRTSTGQDRNDAYRHFLNELAAEDPVGGT